MLSELDHKVALLDTWGVMWYAQNAVGLCGFRLAILDCGQVITLRVMFLGELGSLFPSAGLTYINGHYYIFDLNSAEERLFKAKVIK